MKLTQARFDEIASQVLTPEGFTIRQPLILRWDGPIDEEIYWELFHGRALDQAMTRRRQMFRSWNIRVDGAEEPLISIKFDEVGQIIHVTRALNCYAHEAIASPDNVVETRATTRWMRELIGSVPASTKLPDELAILVFQAVVGAGRLPLTSLEAPLPAFTFGQLGYFPAINHPDVAVKQLEFSLRTGDPGPITDGGLQLLKQVFHGITLSPYTNFVGNALRYSRTLEESRLISPLQRAAFLSYLLRLQWRHLNAYDLVRFHHRGANYPDALMIEELMRELLSFVSNSPDVFEDPMIRRGLRLGWLLRIMYQGLPVPAQPTSPGENQRVLPAPFEHIPDEQISLPHHRPRKLFDQSMECTEPARQVIKRCLDDLTEATELQELGTALILDRPLGVTKSPQEPDRTPMFSHVARSRKLAEKVVGILAKSVPQLLDAKLENVSFAGVPLPKLKRPLRPGVVSIQDVEQTADDFQLATTTRTSICEFLNCYDWRPLPRDWMDLDRWKVITPAANGLMVHDAEFRPWLSLQLHTNSGFMFRRGQEIPLGGLQVRNTEIGREFRVFPLD